MANYTIIGGDGKQYGPITGEELRKWISEGRLSAQSLAKADSDAEFRTLSTFSRIDRCVRAASRRAGRAAAISIRLEPADAPQRCCA